MTETTDIFLNLSIGDLILLAGIIIGIFILLKINKVLFNHIKKKTKAKQKYKYLSLQPIIRLIIIALGTIWVLIIITQPSEVNIITLLAAMSIALGFAFKDYISSIIAGLISLYEKNYQEGDWIEINGVYGEIEAIKLRTIKMRTLDNTEVIIPQLKIWNTTIYNANAGSRNLMCVTNIYLDPNHDSYMVKEIMERVTFICPYTQLEKPIKIRVNELPQSTHYRIKSYPLDPTEQGAYKTNLTMRVKDALRERGIKFSDIPTRYRST
ncbi:MAG: mechanosensitive ion channel [Promethearchaeia archaeon]